MTSSLPFSLRILHSVIHVHWIRNFILDESKIEYEIHLDTEEETNNTPNYFIEGEINVNYS